MAADLLQPRGSLEHSRLHLTKVILFVAWLYLHTLGSMGLNRLRRPLDDFRFSIATRWVGAGMTEGSAVVIFVFVLFLFFFEWFVEL